MVAKIYTGRIQSVALILLVCFAARLYGQSAKKNDKFCPLEKNGDRCRSDKDKFKCAVFYEGLPTVEGRFTWIGGLPDVLAKKKVNESAEIRATFGNMKYKDFEFADGLCDSDFVNATKRAKSRCYAAMLNPSQRKLDECDKNIINEDGAFTLGDILCNQLYVDGIVPRKVSRINDVEITFGYSACTTDWAELDYDGVLRVSEKLCCEREKGAVKRLRRFMFKRCPSSPYGPDFNKKCV